MRKIYRSDNKFIIERSSAGAKERYLLVNIEEPETEPMTGFDPDVFLRFMPYDEFKEYHTGDDTAADKAIKDISSKWNISL